MPHTIAIGRSLRNSPNNNSAGNATGAEEAAAGAGSRSWEPADVANKPALTGEWAGLQCARVKNPSRETPQNTAQGTHTHTHTPITAQHTTQCKERSCSSCPPPLPLLLPQSLPLFVAQSCLTLFSHGPETAKGQRGVQRRRG